MLTPRKAAISLPFHPMNPFHRTGALLQKTRFFRACAVFVLGHSLSGPLLAATFGNFTYVDTGTAITITGYPTTEVGDVIIPASINDKPVTQIGDSAFRGCSLTSVTIPLSVTRIGYSAFDDCVNLEQAIIPSSVTTINTFAYSGCSRLTSVLIPSSVTNFGDVVFQGCTNLTSIEVDPNNTVYSSNDGVLFNKIQTELITYPPGKTGAYSIPPGVTDIKYYAFFWCKNLTGITLPSSVSSIGYEAFSNCTSLAELVIPPHVSHISDYAFYNCSKLKFLMFAPEADLFIGPYAFSHCNGLGRVDFHYDDFQYDIPYSYYFIGQFSFSYCSELKSINLYFTDPTAWYSVHDYAFAYCPALQGAYFQGNYNPISYMYGNEDFSPTIFEGDDSLTVYYIERTTGWESTLAGRPTSPLSATLNYFHLAQGLSPDGSDDFLIPAKDEVPNLHKYAFNMIGNGPGQAAALDIPNTQRMTSSGSAGLPLPEFQESDETRLKWTYIRRKASTSPGITYHVEFTDNLATPSWATNPSATESVTSIDANFERVTLTDSTADAPMRFSRVRVTSP